MRKIIVIILLALPMSIWAQDGNRNSIFKFDSLRIKDTAFINKWASSGTIKAPDNTSIVFISSRTKGRLRFLFNDDSLRISYDGLKVDSVGIDFLNYITVSLRSDTIQKLNKRIDACKAKDLDVVYNPAPIYATVHPKEVNDLVDVTYRLIDKKQYKLALENCSRLRGFLKKDLSDTQLDMTINLLMLKIAEKL